MKGDEMSKMNMTFTSVATSASVVAFVAPTSTSNYPTNTTTWFTKRAYAHFGTEASGVIG